MKVIGCGKGNGRIKLFCKIIGCDIKQHAKSLCHKHYQNYLYALGKCQDKRGYRDRSGYGQRKNKYSPRRKRVIIK